MKYEEYKDIYNNLKSVDDLDYYEKKKYDRRMLESILTQKITRATRKRAHVLKKQASHTYNEWAGGKSFVEIADSLELPPILVAKTIFEKHGTPRKVFWEYVKDPSLLDSSVTARELTEAKEKDFVYSPEGEKRNSDRGKWGEDLLWKWLDGQNLEYLTEADRRGEGKTPDCLLDKPVKLDGKKIYWVESKASFGDQIEFRYNCKNQLIPYSEQFGPGAVVYWTGCLDNLEAPEGIYVYDSSILKKRCKKLD